MANDQGLLIAGEQQESSTGETYDDVNPYTGQSIATIAAASPEDAPTYLSARAVGIPLAVGNTVVLTATEEAPISAGFFIAELLKDAGLPAGALNVITTPPANAETVSRTLISDPRVRRVNFTGSTRVGRKISEMAGSAMKRVVLELGGKNSLIVLADADLDYAVSAAAFSSWINGGQVCMSGDRIIVASEIAEEFAERLAQKAEGLPTGDPADPATVIGPLISASAASRVAGMVDEAVKAGAKFGGQDALREFTEPRWVKQWDRSQRQFPI